LTILLRLIATLRRQEHSQNIPDMQAKEDRKLARQSDLSDFAYEATDENMTFSAMGPQLVDFIRVVGLQKFLKEHLSIKKMGKPL